MKDYTKEFMEDLQEIIARKDVELGRKLLKDLHPADIAELFEELDIADEEFLESLLDREVAAEVLMEMDEDDRSRLLEQMPKKEIAETLELLDTDDAVDLIQELDEEDRDEIIAHIEDVEQAGDIIDLLKYDDDTAGGLMGTEMIVVNENWSMQECVKEMRTQAESEGMDEIYNVYVVDDDNRLKGLFPLQKMITHPSVSKIKHVMETDPPVVKTDTPIEEVALDFEKYNLVAMPVIDSIGRLVGRITVDDVMDTVREQSERDYQLASGISQDVEVDDSILTQTRARLPWLLIGIFGGIANSWILGGFEKGFATNPAMALFIPLIGGTGGNVGTQSSAIVVQGLANGSLDIKNSGKLLFKEFSIAMVNALVISMMVYLYRLISGEPAMDVVTLAVTLSLFAVVLFASVFGSFVPLMFERFKIDPALATGPFITITSDIVGMLIYMVVSSSLISAFGG